MWCAQEICMLCLFIALFESTDSASIIIQIELCTVKRAHTHFYTHANGKNNDPTQNCMAMNFYMCRLSIYVTRLITHDNMWTKQYKFSHLRISDDGDDV